MISQICMITALLMPESYEPFSGKPMGFIDLLCLVAVGLMPAMLPYVLSMNVDVLRVMATEFTAIYVLAQSVAYLVAMTTLMPWRSLIAIACEDSVHCVF